MFTFPNVPVVVLQNLFIPTRNLLLQARLGKADPNEYYFTFHHRPAIKANLTSAQRTVQVEAGFVGFDRLV